ncbi:MAG: AAA family ATPase [Candidatus Kapaibacteriota bacterium]
MTNAKNIATLLETAPQFKPESLIISDSKWKFIVRAVLRGENIMLRGDAGTGKTLAVTTVAKVMDRPFFYFNLGATQDPRSTLIGNTHFNKETGTYFAQSTFVKAIQTEGAVILLDELSRAHPEAWNILMTVLDESQRYLRIDESPDTEVVKVADGVSFLATSNEGIQYTSTRKVDFALADRFAILEIDILSKMQQQSLIRHACPKIDDKTVEILTSIYDQINTELATNNGKIQTRMSTRSMIRAARHICDGFSINEALDLCIYPYFDGEGGLDSERTFVQIIAQKYVGTGDLENDNMFDEADTNK